MEIRTRRAAERGSTKLPWLDSRHAFSFGDAFDPDWLGFGSLRVLNEDRVAPGAGFPPHPHRNAEIVSIVLRGALHHRDDAGGESVLGPGAVQSLSAGRGVVHAEWNPSANEPVHFVQIWLETKTPGGDPRWQHAQPGWREADGFVQLAAPAARATGASVPIDADAEIFAAHLADGGALARRVPASRAAWVQLLAGAAEVAGVRLEPGDALAITGPGDVDVRADGSTELLWLDLGGEDAPDSENVKGGEPWDA